MVFLFLFWRHNALRGSDLAKKVKSPMQHYCKAVGLNV